MARRVLWIARIARILAWVGLSTALLAATGALAMIVWARSPSGRARLLGILVERVQARLDGKLTIARLEGDLTRELVLRDVRVLDPEGMLAVRLERVAARYDLLALARRTLQFSHIDVDGAAVHARAMQNGALNLLALAKPQPEASGRSLAMVVERLGGDATIDYDGAGSRSPWRARLRADGGLRAESGELALHDLRIGARVEGGELDGSAPGTQLRGPIEVELRGDGTTRAGVAARLDARSAGGGWLEVVARGYEDHGAGTILVERLAAEAAGVSARASGQVALGGAPAIDATVDVRAPELSRLSELGIDGIAGRLDAHARVVRGEGPLELDGEVSARGLEAGAASVTRLDAKVHAVGLRGSAKLRARGVDLPGRALRLDRVDLDAVADSQRVALDLDAHGPDGVFARLHARGRPIPDGGSVSALHAPDHAPQHAIDLVIDHVTLGARGERWQSTGPGRLRVGDRELTASLALGDGGAQRLQLAARWARATGAVDASLIGRALDAARLARLATPSVEAPSTRLDVDARMSGTIARPILDAKLRGETLARDDGRVPAVALAVDARLDGGRAHATLDATTDGARVSARVDAPLPLEGDGAISANLIATDVELERVGAALARLGARLPLSRGRVNATVDVRGTLRAPVAVARVEARGLAAAGIDRVDVDLDARYQERRAQGELSARLHDAPILGAQLRIDVDAAHRADWKNAPLAIDATIPSFDLSRFAKRSGAVAGEVRVRGTVAQPLGEASLRGKELAIGELRLARVEARAAFDGDALDATVDATQLPSSGAHLTAHLPRSGGAALAIRLRADALKVALPSVGALRQLDGTLEADLNVTGTRTRPVVNGTVKLDGGALAIAADPRVYRDVTIDVAAQDSTFTLRQLHLKVGTGTLSANGALALDGLRPMRVDLHAQASRLPFEKNNLSAWIDAHVELHGHRQGDALSGELTLTKGKAELPRLAGTRQLQPLGPLEDVVFTDARDARDRKRGEGAPPLEADVLAHIPGPFRVRSPELSTDLSGELELRLAAGALALYGQVETTRGHVELLGRRYEIGRARVAFYGDPNPTLDVRLTREMPGAIIAIEVHGTAREPRLELTSDPPVYDSAQIIGMIVSGDAGDHQMDARSIDQRVVGALSSVLVGRIAEQLAPSLPIDVIKLGSSGASGPFSSEGTTRLEIGKHLGDRVYVSYVHQFGTPTGLEQVNSNEISAEYRFGRHYRVSMRVGDQGIGGLDFFWAVRF